MDKPLLQDRVGIDPSEIPNRFLNQLGPLLILASIFFLNFISRIILAPLIPEIELAFKITHADAGSLFFLISLGFFISMICSGFISSRLNHKRTIIVSSTVLGIAMIGSAFCRDVWSLCLGLLCG